MTMRVSWSAARIATLCVGLGATALTGCETVQDVMGTGKVPPDEYAVAPRRPLVMPPDYNLRAPQPGAPATADINASGAAADAMANAGRGGTGPAEPAPELPPQTQPTEVPTQTQPSE